MIVYKTVNLINNKIYVGKDLHNNPNYLGSGKLLKLAIKKYGKENFKKIIIENCSSIEDMETKEKFWIQELKAQQREIGYNIADGGTGGDTFSNDVNKEQRRGIMRENQIKRFENNPELRKKYSEMNKGEKNYFFGRKLSKNHKDKISQTKKEQFKNNPELRKKCGEKNIGRAGWLKGTKGLLVHSEITKQKMSKSHMGKTATDETKQKISKSHMGKTVTDETKYKLKQYTGEKNSRYIKFSKEEKKFVCTNFNKYLQKDLVEVFNTKFNKKVSITALKRIIKEKENETNNINEK